MSFTPGTRVQATDRCACGARLPVDPCIPEDVPVCDDCCPVCGPDRLRERVT